MGVNVTQSLPARVVRCCTHTHPLIRPTQPQSTQRTPPPPSTQEGKQIEKIVAMTNWDYYEAVERFQRILDATGINKALRKRGAREGAFG